MGIFAETLVGFRLKCLLLLSDSSPIRIRLQIFGKLPTIKTQENPFSVSRSVRCGQTQWHRVAALNTHAVPLFETLAATCCTSAAHTFLCSWPPLSLLYLCAPPSPVVDVVTYEKKVLYFRIVDLCIRLHFYSSYNTVLFLNIIFMY